MKKSLPKIVFFWENAGPTHHDRLRATAKHFRNCYEITCVELNRKSLYYDWQRTGSQEYEIISLFDDHTKVSQIKQFRRLLHTLRETKADYFFLCGYHIPYVFITSILLRLAGKKVFTMQDSKFDDYERHISREILKYILYLPYMGASVGSSRSRDYLRFLGMKKRPIVLNYDSASVERVQNMAGTAPAPDGVDFKDRYFTIIARLIPKKNLFVTLDAYNIYRQEKEAPRPLHIYGNGPLHDELQSYIDKHGLSNHVTIHGFVQADVIARSLGNTLALILASTEEQFGNAIIEAQSMGLPVIASSVCGACDESVRSGVNGFIVHPQDPRGIAYFMKCLSQDKDLWERMCREARAVWPIVDASRFAEGIETLITSRHQA